MPEDPLKFRCYRCNQLIGVPPKRAGSVIACPKCKAELKVPEPQEQAAAVGVGSFGQNSSPQPFPPGLPADLSPTSSPGPIPSFMEEIAAAIPDDLASLRPEDIRVEAEFADLVVTVSERGSSSPTATAAQVPGPTSEPLASARRPAVVAPRPINTVPDPSPPRFEPLEEPPVDVAIGTVLPNINIEPATILPAGRETHPVSEVVLQPATVLAWSLLVLMALPLAFVAGLLMGHFVWK
jgi:hypothetical protein